MENDIFHCFVQEKKQERKNREENNSSGLTFFILSIWEENRKEKLLNDIIYINTLSLFISPTLLTFHCTCDLITFASLSLSLS